jgi:hypothetical protein
MVGAGEREAESGCFGKWLLVVGWCWRRGRGSRSGLLIMG